MPQRFKHNKKRDVGLVYEFLIRRISRTLVEGDQEGYQKALAITRRYFSDSSPLAQEKELFDVIRNNRGITESAARRILLEVSAAAKKLDRKKIDIKKSNLIKEINYAFGKDFFSEHRVPDYRVIATIQMIIDSALQPKALTETVQRIQLEEVLVNHMTSVDRPDLAAPNKDIDHVVMAMAAKRFQERYSESLDANQKMILEKYIRSLATGDEYPLSTAIVSEVKRIHESLEKARSLPEVVKDKEMRARLDEASSKFESLTRGENLQVSEELIEQVMLYQRLCSEVESDA